MNEESNKIFKVEPLWFRDFILITILNFLIYLSFQMLHPTLPVYARVLGGNDAAAGLLVGVLTLAAVLIRPFTGLLLDRCGRKWIFFTGLISLIIIVSGYIWAPSIGALMVIRFSHGLSWGIAGTASSTVASDLIPKSRFGEGTGYFNLTTTLTMALAPALGLYLIQHYNFPIMFTVSVSLTAIATLISLVIKYRAIITHKRHRSLLERTALMPSLTIFLISMTYGPILTFIPLYTFEESITNIGPFFTVFASVMFITRPFVGRCSDKYGLPSLIIPGALLIGLAMFILYSAHSLLGFLEAGVCYGLGYGAVFPSLQAMAVIAAPPDRRGVANGNFLTGLDLGVGISAVIYGFIAQRVGYRSMYLWTLVPLLLASVGFLLLRRKKVINNYSNHRFNP
ncbi:MAG: MFS transporter [Bacteroidota bacterium]